MFSQSDLNIKFNSTLFIQFLLLCLAILFLGHCLSIYLLFQYPESKIDGSYLAKLVQLFNLDLEANLPTLFSSLILFINAFMLAFIAVGHKDLNSKYLPWVGLSFIFFFLAVDEMITIHEHLIDPTRKLFNTKGYFYYAWVIPYGILVAIIGIFYFKFIFCLPRKTLTLYRISAVVFMPGAIGMETLSSMEVYTNGSNNNFNYYLIITIEELLEMIGAIIFCYANLDYITKNFNLTIFQFSKM